MPEKVGIHVNIPPEVYDRIRSIADQYGTTLSDTIAKLCLAGIADLSDATPTGDAPPTPGTKETLKLLYGEGTRYLYPGKSVEHVQLEDGTWWAVPRGVSVGTDPNRSVVVALCTCGHPLPAHCRGIDPPLTHMCSVGHWPGSSVDPCPCTQPTFKENVAPEEAPGHQAFREEFRRIFGHLPNEGPPPELAAAQRTRNLLLRGMIDSLKRFIAPNRGGGEEGF